MGVGHPPERGRKKFTIVNGNPVRIGPPEEPPKEEPAPERRLGIRFEKLFLGDAVNLPPRMRVEFDPTQYGCKSEEDLQDNKKFRACLRQYNFDVIKGALYYEVSDKNPDGRTKWNDMTHRSSLEHLINGHEVVFDTGQINSLVLIDIVNRIGEMSEPPLSWENMVNEGTGVVSRREREGGGDTARILYEYVDLIFTDPEVNKPPIIGEWERKDGYEITKNLYFFSTHGSFLDWYGMDGFFMLKTPIGWFTVPIDVTTKSEEAKKQSKQERGAKERSRTIIISEDFKSDSPTYEIRSVGSTERVYSAVIMDRGKIEEVAKKVVQKLFDAITGAEERSEAEMNDYKRYYTYFFAGKDMGPKAIEEIINT